MWVRGLKRIVTDITRLLYMSHPVWVRGLKLMSVKRPHNLVSVAPRVGAWIETINGGQPETGKPSHPVWVRGLKLTIIANFVSKLCRTPCGCVD